MPEFIKGTNIEILPSSFGDEPEPICANCDCYASLLKRCINRTSIWYTFNPEPHDRCERFFPDHKRWPDADHD